MLGGGVHGNGSLGNWVTVESSGATPLEDVVANSVDGTPDINAVATMDGGEVDVLLWNYHDADVEVPPAAVHLQVNGLREGKWTAAEFRMDATHSNSYRAWQQMGSPAHPDKDQIAKLEKASALEQTVADHPVAVKDGKTEVDLALPRQGVVLVRLKAR
jgi:xylan 1,4-beta-xylosidase